MVPSGCNLSGAGIPPVGTFSYDDKEIRKYNKNNQAANFFFSVNVYIYFKKWYHRMGGQKRCQVLFHTNWTHARTTSAMGNAKCFVEIEMANISSNPTWASETHL